MFIYETRGTKGTKGTRGTYNLAHSKIADHIIKANPSDKKNDTLNIIKNWSKLRFTLIFDGIIIGAFTGLIIVLFRYLILKGEALTQKVYAYTASDLKFIPLLFLGLMTLGFIIGFLIKKEPLIRGSGIPQVEGFLLKKMDMSWWRVLAAKFTGTVISISSGLSMGREGPSVQIGASIGLGYSRILKKTRINESFLVTSGASAGLAAAFNAPLSGVIFALEEVHKNFSSLVLLSAISAAITADFISLSFFGMDPIFNIRNIKVLPLNSYIYILILGLILGLFGALFNITLIKIKDLYTRHNWLSAMLRPLIPFMIIGVAGLLIPQALGGGHGIVDSLTNNEFSWKFLLILLIVKFFLTMISYGSGAPGGIFMPLLVIGAIIGTLASFLFSNYFHFNNVYMNNLMILSMAGYFAAIVKAPITGIVLITEMTGSFSHILPLTIVVMISYIVSSSVGTKPIYESLLERSLVNEDYTKFKIDKKTKIIMETFVSVHSEIDGKILKEICLPQECLLISIKRGGNEIIPKGDTRIEAGDQILVLADENNANDILDKLSKITGHSEIKIKFGRNDLYNRLTKNIKKGLRKIRKTDKGNQRDV